MLWNAYQIKAYLSCFLNLRILLIRKFNTVSFVAADKIIFMNDFRQIYFYEITLGGSGERTDKNNIDICGEVKMNPECCSILYLQS